MLIAAGQQCDCVVGLIEQPVQGRAAVTHPLGHFPFKHSLFDLLCDHFLDHDGAVPISVDSINGQTRLKARKIDSRTHEPFLIYQVGDRSATRRLHAN
jgi:hypothetical protein